MCGGVLGEPGHEQRIEQADERRDPLDGSSLSGGRLGEAKILLEVAEADLNSPPSGVALEDLTHRAGGIGAEENTTAERPGRDLDDDDAEQTDAASAIPLPRHLLVANRAPLPVEVGLAGA